MARARGAGVDRILAVGTDLASSLRTIQLAEGHENIFAAVGMHPHEATRFRAEATGLETLIGRDRVVGVGEIGLDYVRNGASKHHQLEAFRQQLGWACERNLWASIHNRGADRDVLDGLMATNGRAVLHCFDGSWEFAREALSVGCYLSFAGNLTFPKAEGLRAVAAQVPLERTLVETDSPVLAPQPWRGRRNEPAYVTAVAETLAGIHGVSLESLAETISSNANRIFGWRPL